MRPISDAMAGPDEPTAWPPPGKKQGVVGNWPDTRVVAGVGIVIASALVILSGLVSGLGGERPSGVRFVIKALGLGGGFLGSPRGGLIVVSAAGAAFVGVALLVALSCIHGIERGVPRPLVTGVAAGAAAEAGWLLLFTLLGLLVDLTVLGDEGFTAFVVLVLADLASAVLFSAVLYWSVLLLLGGRTRPG